MTPARLAALREAERKASKAPWTQEDTVPWDKYRGVWRDIVKRPDGSFFQVTGHDNDAALIALMRNELPALLDALETRTALLKRVRGSCWEEERALIDAELGGGS